MRYYVEINGISSLTLEGFAIKELPPISKPPIRTQREEIDGRDGDIITKLGYGAYDKQIEVGLYGDFYDINKIIAFFNSEGIVTFSNEPDKYYNFTIVNQIDFEKLLRFKTATITFHCQPFKYKKDEEPILIEYQYVEGEGTNFTLDNTASDKMTLDLKGNTSQNGTPTPSSPIPVNVVSGDNEINIVSNMFDLTNGILNNTTKGTYTYDESDNSFTLGINGTGNYVYTEFLCGKICDDNITVSFDFTSITGANVTNWWYRITNSEKYNDLVFASSEYSNMNRTFDTSSYKGKYLWIVIRNNTNSSALYSAKFSNFMVNSGTTALPYIQHKEATYLINLPVENLLNVNTLDNAGGSSLTVDISNNEIKMTQSGSVTYQYRRFMTDLDINKYKGKTISFSYKVDNTNSRAFLALYKSDKTLLGDLQSTSYTIPSDTTASYIGLQIYQSYSTGVNGTVTFSELQIEKSTKANSYTPHGTTPIELCKIGDYQDYFLHDKTLDKWYWHREVGKVVLNGSEDWVIFNSSSSRVTFRTIINGIEGYTNGNTIPNITSNRFIPNSYNATWVIGNVSRTTASGGQNFALFVYEPNTTVEQFKAWLSSNNIIAYYVLETPTDTEITYQPLIDQLNAIEKAMSKDGQTNISQVNNDLPFIIKATAKEYGSDRATITNEGNIYSKPILNVVGSGTINVDLNGNQIFILDLSDSTSITIDPEKLEAYNPRSMNLMNRKVTGDISNLKLPEGENELSISGNLTNATITKYSRWL